MKDYYYILGLAENASTIEVKKAYRKLSLKFHPDKNEGDKFFEERFKDILEAYETLSNERLRSAYDAKRNSSKSEGGQTYQKTVPAPKVTELKADKHIIEPGDVVKISWNTENATSVLFNCFDGEQEKKGTKSVKISSSNPEFIIAIEARNQVANAVARREITLRSVKQEVEKPAEPEPSNSKNDLSNWGVISAVLLILVVVIFLLTTDGLNTKLESNDLQQSSTQDDASSSSRTLSEADLVGYDWKPAETIQKFFDLINSGDYKSAYKLTDNELWHPYENFAQNAWGNLSQLEAKVFMKKDFLSKYGGEVIIETEYSVYDANKKALEVRTHDFHLRHSVSGYWQIIRLVHPQDEYLWYEDDPLFKEKNDPLVSIFNKPHVLLQAYYDNFRHRDIVNLENGKYYGEHLIVYHDRDWILRKEAVRLDYEDFVRNDIFSYQILLDSYNMMTEDINGLKFVHVPLNYYVTKNDSTRNKFTVSIDALLNEDCSAILAIGNGLTIDRLKEVSKRIQQSQ